MALVTAPVSSAQDRTRLDVILAAHPADSEEFLREIHQSGFHLSNRLVEDLRHLAAALENTRPDVVVISSRVAGFSGAAAGNLLQSIKGSIPIVVVLDRDEPANTNLLLDVLRDGASNALFRDQMYALRSAVCQAARVDGSELRGSGDPTLATQIRHAAELASNNRRLETQIREAERNNKVRSELMAPITHELRGRLQTIMGFAELLSMELKGPLNEEQQQYIAYIQRDSRRLLSLICEVADLGRIEAGQMELRLETLEAEPVILESLAAMRPLADAGSISLEQSLAPGLVLRVDRVRLREILCYLVDNAVKFTPEGGRIWVESRKLGGCARISVRDTGIGPANHVSIFELFRNGDFPAGGNKGAGLGLIISRRLVELHGGKIWVESDIALGSQVHFTIPLAAERE